MYYGVIIDNEEARWDFLMELEEELEEDNLPFVEIDQEDLDFDLMLNDKGISTLDRLIKEWGLEDDISYTELSQEILDKYKCDLFANRFEEIVLQAVNKGFKQEWPPKDV